MDLQPVHTFGNGVSLKREPISGAIVVVSGNTWLSAFSPDNPVLLPRTYIQPLTEMALGSHLLCGGGVLHLGGSAMSSARCLAASGVFPQTVVDIDEQVCSEILRRWPVPGSVQVVYDDARRVVRKFSHHPTVIVDVGCGPFDADAVSLDCELIGKFTETRATEPTTVLVNLHLYRDAETEGWIADVSEAMSVLGPVTRWDNGSYDHGGVPAGNTLLAASNVSAVSKVLRDRLSWDGWNRV